MAADRAKPVVLITGASAGIGRALALAWAREGATLVLMARREAELEVVAREVVGLGGQAFTFAGDVTKDATRRALVDFALEKAKRIDVLVNNAGRGFYAPVRSIAVADLEHVFALNVFAPLHLTQLCTDALARTSGTVVMVSSVAGIAVTPTLGAYSASKFALEALSIAMRAELAPSGIHVLVVRPGPVETEFRENALRRDATGPSGDKRQDPAEVAKRTLKAVARHKAVLETSLFVRAASFTARVLPGALRIWNNRQAHREHL